MDAGQIINAAASSSRKVSLGRATSAKAFRSRGTKIPTSARGALTSAATFDWGSSTDLQRFAMTVLGPARVTKATIDLDCATSEYWQRWWHGGNRPAHFFDGKTAATDALNLEAWDMLRTRLGGVIGGVFCNPPGLENGSVVKQFWRLLEDLYFRHWIDSLVWIGFNLDQARALIPSPLALGDDAEDEGDKDTKDWRIHPLHPDALTVFPGRRVPYRAHPAHMISILEKRLASKRCKGSERGRIAARREALIARSSDAPVPGPSPTHASYVTVLLSHDRARADAQRALIAGFLADDVNNAKSVFRTSAAIGVSL